MPAFVATIEVYFDAPTLEDANWFADTCADTVVESTIGARITATTSNVAPDTDSEAS